MPQDHYPMTFAILVEVTIDKPGHEPEGEEGFFPTPRRYRTSVATFVRDAVSSYGGQYWPGHTFFPKNLKVKVY